METAALHPVLTWTLKELYVHLLRFLRKRTYNADNTGGCSHNHRGLDDPAISLRTMSAKLVKKLCVQVNDIMMSTLSGGCQ